MRRIPDNVDSSHSYDDAHSSPELELDTEEANTSFIFDVICKTIESLWKCRCKLSPAYLTFSVHHHFQQE